MTQVRRIAPPQGQIPITIAAGYVNASNPYNYVSAKVAAAPPVVRPLPRPRATRSRPLAARTPRTRRSASARSPGRSRSASGDEPGRHSQGGPLTSPRLAEAAV